MDDELNTIGYGVFTCQMFSLYSFHTSPLAVYCIIIFFYVALSQLYCAYTMFAFSSMRIYEFLCLDTCQKWRK